MLLTYGDLANLFPKRNGIQDYELCFHTVATTFEAPLVRGIYIPLDENTGDLKKAIENGAVAALWKEEEKIPRYTPNHFPIFFTNDLMKGLKDMMELYLQKLNLQEKAEIKVTNFHITNNILLKENNFSNDLAVIAKKIMDIRNQLQVGTEGAK